MIRRILTTVAVLVALVGAAEAQTNALRIGTAIVSPGTASSAQLPVDALAAEPIGGVSFGVSLPIGFDFEAFVVTDADFVGLQSGVDFVAIGVLFSITALEQRGPGFIDVGKLTIGTPSLAAGSAIELPITGGLGSPPVPVEFATIVGPAVPITLSGGVVAATPPESQLWIASAASDELQIVDSDGTAGAVIAGGSALDPHSIAVDANGFAWVTYRGSNSVRRFDSSGTEVFVFGTASTIATGTSPEGIAIDRFGAAWVANAGDSTVSRVDSFGRVLFGGDGPPIDSAEDGVLGPAIVLSTPPRAIASDRFGSVWVVGSDGASTASVARINRSGLIAFQLQLGANDPVDIAVDRAGFGWLALRGGDRVERRASDGALVATYSVPSPSAIALRVTATGGREAWVIGNDGSADGVFRLQSDGTIDTFASPAASSLTGITIDGAGRPWVTVDDGTVLRIDPASTPTAPTVTATAASLVGANILGDATGYTQASVHFRSGDPQLLSLFDFDGDAFANSLELTVGTDVFDAASTPAVDVAPVQALVCTATDGSATDGTVTLGWSNATAYDEIQVFVDSALQASLSGVSTSHSFTLASGQYLVEVVAVIGASSSDAEACTTVVGAGEVIESVAVISEGDLINPHDVAVTNLSGPCVPAFLITDPEDRLVYCLDEEQAVIDSFSSDLFVGDFGAFGVAYDPFGNGGTGSIFLAGGKEGEQVEIVEVDLQGQTFTSSSALMVADGLGFAIEGRPGGLTLRSTLGTETILLFSEPDFCEIFALLASGSGEILPDASFGHPSMFVGFGLNGLTVSGEFSATGGSVWLTTGTGVDGEYGVSEFAVSSGVATATGNTIPLQNVTDENVLGGFGFVRNDEEKRFELSVIGITTSSLYGVLASTFFIRGDANSDGGIDIADPIAILGVLFSAEDPATCATALDANGDGGFDIADAIFLLSFLFSAGPAPTEPYPDAGGDLFECS